jgi:hypothetical protein
MMSFFSFIEKALASLGLNFESSDQKFDKFLRIFSLGLVLLVALQSLLFFATTEVFGIDTAMAITFGLFAIQGCAKMITVLMNFDKLKKIRGSLEELSRTMKVESDPENVKQFDRFRKYTKTSLITDVLCIWIFSIKSALEIIIFTLSGSEVKNFLMLFTILQDVLLTTISSFSTPMRQWQVTLSQSHHWQQTDSFCC